MASCMTILTIAVPLIGVLAFICLQSVRVEFRVTQSFKSDVGTVFEYFKNPENLYQMISTIRDVKIIEQESVLDDADGYMKEKYLVEVTQDFPSREGVKFNFTRTASASENTIESQGAISFLTQFSTLYKVSANKDGSVTVKLDISMTLARALSWWLPKEAEKNHIKSMEIAKAAVETKKRDMKV